MLNMSDTLLKPKTKENSNKIKTKVEKKTQNSNHLKNKEDLSENRKLNKLIQKSKHLKIKDDLSQKIVMEAISDNNLVLAENFLQDICNSKINNKLFDVQEMLLSIASCGTVEMLKVFLQWPIVEENLEDDKFGQEMLTKAYSNRVDEVGMVKNLLDLQYIKKVVENDIHAYNLRCAIQEASIDLVKLLLNQDGVLKNINPNQDWILTDAIKCGNVEILKLLLSQKALDSHIKDNLVTYISEALLFGSINTAQFLIAHSPFNEEELINHLYDNPERLKKFLKLEYGLNYVKSKSKTIFLDIVNLRNSCTSQYDCSLYDEIIKILLSMPEIKNEHQSLEKAHDLLSKCYYPTKEILNMLKDIIVENNLSDKINRLEIEDRQNPKRKMSQ